MKNSQESKRETSKGKPLEYLDITFSRHFLNTLTLHSYTIYDKSIVNRPVLELQYDLYCIPKCYHKYVLSIAKLCKLL